MRTSTRDEYTKLLSDTNRSYYSEQIAESAGDTKKLFNIVNSLCKVDDRYDALPTNDFGAFFIKKIELIQQDIEKIVVNQPEVQVQLPQTSSC